MCHIKKWKRKLDTLMTLDQLITLRNRFHFVWSPSHKAPKRCSMCQTLRHRCRQRHRPGFQHCPNPSKQSSAVYPRAALRRCVAGSLDPRVPRASRVWEVDNAGKDFLPKKYLAKEIKSRVEPEKWEWVEESVALSSSSQLSRSSQLSSSSPASQLRSTSTKGRRPKRALGSVQLLLVSV